MKRSVEVHVPGKPLARRVLEAPVFVTVGGDAFALVEKGGTLEGPVALELVPRDEGVLVDVKPGASSAVRHEGREIKNAVVPWGDEVFFLGARLSFVLDASGADRARAFLVGLGGVAAVVALFFGVGTLRSQARGLDPEAPELVKEAARCAQPDARGAEIRAREAETLGRAKRERYPFDPADGPEALALLREAAACFGSAGRTQDAMRTNTAAREWAERVESDYAALRTRLRVALDGKHSTEALRAAKELELLLSRNGEHPYREWLSARRRELEQKAAPGGSR